jgi:hypothetical protein
MVSQRVRSVQVPSSMSRWLKAGNCIRSSTCGAGEWEIPPDFLLPISQWIADLHDLGSGPGCAQLIHALQRPLPPRIGPAMRPGPGIWYTESQKPSDHRVPIMSLPIAWCKKKTIAGPIMHNAGSR